MAKKTKKEPVQKDWIVTVHRRVETEVYVSAVDEDDARDKVLRGDWADQREIQEMDCEIDSVTENI